jgi:hypothetical protein
VSEAIGHLNDKLSRDGSKLQSDISDVNQLSHSVENKWMMYTEEAELEFEDDKTRISQFRCRTDKKLLHW